MVEWTAWLTNILVHNFFRVCAAKTLASVHSCAGLTRVVTHYMIGRKVRLQTVCSL